MIPQISISLSLDLSEPGKKLIKAVSQHIERRFEPNRIRNEAQARADASRINAQAEIDIADLRQRSAHRLLAQELQNQRNIETIISKAAKQVETSPENDLPITEDWLHRFITAAQEVTDEQLQALWARLLSGEFQSPGRFSRRVLRLLRELDPSDIQAIEEASTRTLIITCADGTERAFLNVHLLQEWILGHERETGLLGTSKLSGISLLQELGVIEYQDSEFSFRVEGPLNPTEIHLSGSSIRAIRMGSDTILAAHNQPNFLRRLGSELSKSGAPQINIWMKAVTFDGWCITSLGEQLFKLCTREPDIAYFTTLKLLLQDAGMQLSSDIVSTRG